MECLLVLVPGPAPSQAPPPHPVQQVRHRVSPSAGGVCQHLRRSQRPALRWGCEVLQEVQAGR